MMWLGILLIVAGVVLSYFALDLEKTVPPAPTLNPYRCPDCGSTLFYTGPEGGASINVKCANVKCGHKFNACPPFSMEPIDNDDRFYRCCGALTIRQIFGIPESSNLW